MADKDLHTMIRIRKWDVEEKQRSLGVLLRREEAILDAQAALAAEMKQEAAFVGAAEPSQRLTFSAYLEHCDMRKQAMAAALVEARKLIDAARDQLAESFRALKTFEVTQENRDAAAAAEETRLENIELGEMGLELHRRKAS